MERRNIGSSTLPYTSNSERINEGIDPEVMVVQTWENSQFPPDIDNLLVEFQTFLVDQKLIAEIKEKKSEHLSNIEAFGRIKVWVLKCSQFRRLEPSEYHFDYLIGKAIERASKV
jgi:hypothetical protein